MAASSSLISLHLLISSLTASPHCISSLHLLTCSHDSYRISNGYIAAGNDLATANVTIAEAEKHCSSIGACVGFTFEKTALESKTECTAITGTQKILYKSSMSGDPASTWCKILKPPSPVGVFFENVQPLLGSFVY
jgi:hypothetical protein